MTANQFIFRQDGTPAHRSRETVAFLAVNIPKFIELGSWTAQTWIWSTIWVEKHFNNLSIDKEYMTWIISKKCQWAVGKRSCRTWPTKQLNGGWPEFDRWFGSEEDTLDSFGLKQRIVRQHKALYANAKWHNFCTYLVIACFSCCILAKWINLTSLTFFSK